MELNLITKSQIKLDAMQALGINNVIDLISHYPYRYTINEYKNFEEWEKDDKVCFEAEIISPMRTNYYGKFQSVTRFSVLFEDNEIAISLFNRAYMKQLNTTSNITITGKYDGNYKVSAINISFKPISEELGIFPVYNIKEGISQKELIKYIKKGLVLMEGKIVDVVPCNYIDKYHLISKEKAINEIHFPHDQASLKQALRHLKYEEFLKFHVSMLSIKKQEQVVCGIVKHFKQSDIDAFINDLPFTLTDEQLVVVNELLYDLRSEKIMYRLLQGDVGSGKTVVSAVAMYATVLSGQQSVLMAPTEILAKQHYESFKLMFPKLNIVLLCASLKNNEREEALKAISTGTAQLIIGTHSLFQDSVTYHDIGLVVADEQHRFGVEQRRKLKEKGTRVDFLLMSATPIPRTLAISLFGDMDVSTITNLPLGRKKIKTKIIRENSLKPILNGIFAYLDEGFQIYIICPLVEESEKMDLKNTNDIYNILKQVFNGRANIGLLHGKMKSEEKELVMEAFMNNEVQILVSTTVVEVGVNVTNANMMIIYDADRFGLSQLHQLRGRVGRGLEQGQCYLLTKNKDPEALARLKVIENSTDGFEIAKQDLMLRGSGDILGKRQSGVSGFVLGDIVVDSNILEVSRVDACAIMDDIELEQNLNIKRWLKKTQISNYID